ncbi:hypothetical protein KIN20_018217 [Parelaphostrongylus tenuis]|uniref:Uncharacterized protein n=1 Tax=Parelaphostrongylus tenuis TaxID=148309 RepID=A0AAD5MML2_PARTN|nr:hypothetical protein KIN20_018217 [Parelaphostrongylus tenuis]
MILIVRLSPELFSLSLRGLPRNELTGQGLCGGPYVEAENILPPIANIGRDIMFINTEGMECHNFSVQSFNNFKIAS